MDRTIFRDDPVHPDIILICRNTLNLLAGEGNPDLHHARMAHQEPVIVSGTVTQAIAARVEGQHGNYRYGDIVPLYGNLMAYGLWHTEGALYQVAAVLKVGEAERHGLLFYDGDNNMFPPEKEAIDEPVRIHLHILGDIGEDGIVTLEKGQEVAEDLPALLRTYRVGEVHSPSPGLSPKNTLQTVHSSTKWLKYNINSWIG